MGTPNGDPEKVRELGWRQGSILPPSLFLALEEVTRLDFKEGESFPVVISQDCDVIHHSYEEEPEVEIIRAVIVESADGNLRHAKSARRLDLDVQVKGSKRIVRLRAQDKRSLDRRILERAAPDANVTLSDAATRLLAHWLAKRYNRDSFPDEFDRRLHDSPAWATIRKLLAGWGVSISGVFVLVRPDTELPPEKHYELTLWATVPSEYYDDAAIRASLEEKFLDKLTTMLSTVDGIKLVDAMVVSEEDFSVGDIKRNRKMDFDSLSFRDDTTIAKT